MHFSGLTKCSKSMKRIYSLKFFMATIFSFLLEISFVGSVAAQ